MKEGLPREETGTRGGGPTLNGTTTEFMAAATGGRSGGVRAGEVPEPQATPAAMAVSAQGRAQAGRRQEERRQEAEALSKKILRLVLLAKNLGYLYRCYLKVI